MNILKNIYIIHYKLPHTHLIWRRVCRFAPSYINVFFLGQAFILEITTGKAINNPCWLGAGVEPSKGREPAGEGWKRVTKRSKAHGWQTSWNVEERNWTGGWMSSSISVIFTGASRRLLKAEKWRWSVGPSWGGCTQHWINNKINNSSCSGDSRRAEKKPVACSLTETDATANAGQWRGGWLEKATANVTVATVATLTSMGLLSVSLQTSATITGQIKLFLSPTCTCLNVWSLSIHKLPHKSDHTSWDIWHALSF